MKIELSQIRPNSWNCNFLGTEERNNLKCRMEKDGVEKTPPIIVRKMARGVYELVDGEQRWAIAKELGWIDINVIERQATDLQAKVLCVGYNRWRGKLNWFKLYDVLSQDLEAGVDVYVVYREALTFKEIENVLSLGKIVLGVRKSLEEAVIKGREIPLDHLYLISICPDYYQAKLAQKIKENITTKALMQTVNALLPRKQTFTGEDLGLERTVKSDKESPAWTKDFQEEFLLSEQWPILKMSERLSEEEVSGALVSTLEDETYKGKRKNRDQQGILVEGVFECGCGCRFRVNFERKTVMEQKKRLFEYVYLKPRIFQIHCDVCSTEQEVIVEDHVGKSKEIFCRRCKSLLRKGELNVNTGYVKWFE